MRAKVLLTVAAMFALFVVWVPSASAKASWSYGDGPTDLSVDAVTVADPPLSTSVCRHITGLAGQHTESLDPNFDPWADSSNLPTLSSGFTVNLYVGDFEAFTGAQVVSGGLLLQDGTTAIPTQTVQASPVAPVNPADRYDNPAGGYFFEYSSAPFTFTVPDGTPAWSAIAIQNGSQAPVITKLADCTTTTLTSNTNPSQGEFGSFTATVKSQNGAAVTHGGVKFMVDGNTVAANVQLVAGEATYAGLISFLTPGDHVVTAMYLGAQNPPNSQTAPPSYAFAQSEASLTQTVSSPDTTPPDISYSLSPSSPGDGGWYTTPVTLTWSVTDLESQGSVIKTGCVDQTISSDQAKTDYSCSATSDGGSAGSQPVTVGYDATPPTLAPSLGANSSFALGQLAPAVTAGAADATSGLASQSCGTIDTFTIGTKSVTCTATDNAGNTASVTTSYSVTDAFLGFSYPSSKTSWGHGSTIPVTFKLGTYQGTARASKATVRVTVAPASQTSPPPPTSTSCTCLAGPGGGYLCLLKLPSTAGSYKIWVWENLGTSANPHYVVLQNASAVVGKTNANPLTITVR
jgi:hypothetical protein